MSYIDTFDHELVGFFAGFPVYHPLETVASDPFNAEDFGCTPAHLVIGGGSGEHPGLVLRRPECAVAHFITEWVDRTSRAELQTGTSQSSTAPDAWTDALRDLLGVNWSEIWHFAGWSVTDYHEFHGRCMSAAMMRPFDPTADSSFEHWLSVSLGEFIFFAMPELASVIDQVLPGAHATMLDASYLNVLTAPPGYRLPFGRRLREGRVVWGNVRWFAASTEENKALVRRFQEELWRGNVALVDELMAPDISIGGTGGWSREQFKAYVLDTLAKWPDFKLKIEEMIADGDKVVYRWTTQGTHTSEIPTPYGPAAPTGKVITATGIHIYRVQDGKVVEDRLVSDGLGFYQQLGVIPMPSQSSS